MRREAHDCSQKDVLVSISRASLSTMAEYKQNIQTNQTVFSYSGKELIATTGDGQVKIFDFPSMVRRLLFHYISALT